MIATRGLLTSPSPSIFSHVIYLQELSIPSVIIPLVSHALRYGYWPGVNSVHLSAGFFLPAQFPGFIILFYFHLFVHALSLVPYPRPFTSLLTSLIVGPSYLPLRAATRDWTKGTGKKTEVTWETEGEVTVPAVLSLRSSFLHSRPAHSTRVPLRSGQNGRSREATWKRAVRLCSSSTRYAHSTPHLVSRTAVWREREGFKGWKVLGWGLHEEQPTKEERIKGVKSEPWDLRSEAVRPWRERERWSIRNTTFTS